MPELCFFCKTEKDERSLVCPTCGRDTAVPSPLAAEHQALSQKRDRLRAELAEAKAQLESYRRKPMSA
jgi:uncharacterized Zn finger protein (UPF0148 family)